MPRFSMRLVSFETLRVALIPVFIIFGGSMPAFSGEKVLLDSLSPAEVEARGRIEVHHPSGYDHAKPYPLPLVILLHGFGANGSIQNSVMGFGEHVEKGGFLFVHPNGTRGDPIGFTGLIRPRFWNATIACCQQFGPAVDDEAFLLSLIDKIDGDARLSVDRSQIYLIGHSNGAKMAHRLACKVPSKFAAIVTIAGTTYSDPANCRTNGGATPKMNVLHIHGIEDEVIKFDGGSSIRLPKNLVPIPTEISLGKNRRYPGALTTVEAWAQFNGCGGAKAPLAAKLDLVEGGGPETEVVVYDCAAHPHLSVELWKMLGAIHIPHFSDQFAEQILSHIGLLK